MSNKGEKICPLCAEEMDLTDQHLKPCKCGYEICVWCWHHILDLAEKNNTGGRCPACRAPYDKEKVVGMAANCERLVAESNGEKRMKNQKAKSKLSEARKQLNDVRVIQRNLVYIVGLPLNLADESLLQQQDYFGKYGKVSKVSMSRTAAGAIQQFPNSTCSVYITYSKEDEAIRCIQSVHGFVLEGRPLKACFGTTKYCHAWLRNASCSNPDCVYLHEVGSQEDSFAKDEIISAYTRSRVQITGSANNMHCNSGNGLPPPVDGYLSPSSGKPIAENASSNSSTNMKGSPSNGSSGRPVVLPAAAAWGTRATGCQPHAGGLLDTNGPSKAKPDTFSSTLSFSSAVASTIQASALHSDVSQRSTSSVGNHVLLPIVDNEKLNLVKQYSSSMDDLQREDEKDAISKVSSIHVNLNRKQSTQTLSGDSDTDTCTKVKATNSTDIPMQLCRSSSEEAIAVTNEEIQNLCCDVSSIDIDRGVRNEHHGITKPNSPPSDCKMIKSSLIKGSQNDADIFRDEVANNVASKAAISDNGLCNPTKQGYWGLDSQGHVVTKTTEVEDDTTYFDDSRFKDPEFCPYLPKPAHFVDSSNHFSPHLRQHGDRGNSIYAGALAADNKLGDDHLLGASSTLFNGYPEKLICSSPYNLIDRTTQHSLVHHEERNEQCVRSFPTIAADVRSDAAMDKGDSGIISNILSMDFEPWEGSLTLPQNLATLLGDEACNQCDPFKKSDAWKVHNNSQSRFAFARQEESKIQTRDALTCIGGGRQLTTCSLTHDFAERDFRLHKLGSGNGFPIGNLEESENSGSGHPMSSNKLSVVSRGQIAAPPGFSVPSRAPPPGFSTHERVEQAYDSLSGDIEFNDPAILAVGKIRVEGSLNSTGLDMRSNFSPQFNHLENEARLQLLMQQSLLQQQNLKFSEIGNTFSQLSDSYRLPSRLDQSQASNLFPLPQLPSQQTRNAILSNGHWDGWNQVQSGNNLEVAELLRNERFGLNNFYAGYEDSKYRMQNSGGFYNRAYGM